MQKPLDYKMFCKHDAGFIWFFNQINEQQGYSCKCGCGFVLEFNPDRFLEGPDVKILNKPNPSVEWKTGVKLSEYRS